MKSRSLLRGPGRRRSNTHQCEDRHRYLFEPYHTSLEIMRLARNYQQERWLVPASAFCFFYFLLSDVLPLLVLRR